MITSNVYEELSKRLQYPPSFSRKLGCPQKNTKRNSLTYAEHVHPALMRINKVLNNTKPAYPPKKRKEVPRFEKYFNDKTLMPHFNTNLELLDIAEEKPGKHSPKIFHISPTSLKVNSKILAKCPNSDKNRNNIKHFDFKNIPEEGVKTDRSPSKCIRREEN